jgi:hypothetical protein
MLNTQNFEHSDDDYRLLPMTAKKNLLVLCLLSASGALSPIANGLELVNVPDATQPSATVQTPQAGVDSAFATQPNKSHSGAASLDVRSLQHESREVIVSGQDSSSPSPAIEKLTMPEANTVTRNTNTIHLKVFGSDESIRLDSLGNDVPFPTALRLMLSEDWTVHLADSLRSNAHQVSWREGENRLMALTRILNNHPHAKDARINWDTKTLFVSDRDVSENGIAAWTVNAGTSLRDTLSQWAVIEGWDIAWDYEGDFILAASAKFKGTFPEVVEQLVHSTQGANKKINVDMWRKNTFIHVTSRKGALL